MLTRSMIENIRKKRAAKQADVKPKLEIDDKPHQPVKTPAPQVIRRQPEVKPPVQDPVVVPQPDPEQPPVESPKTETSAEPPSVESTAETNSAEQTPTETSETSEE